MINDIISHAGSGRGTAMVWNCMAASGMGSLIFTDDVIHDDLMRINSQVKLGGIS